MSVADDKYKELILDIHKNGSWDKGGEVRTKYADGTPAYTKSVFGRQVVFEDGEIPLLTSKYVGWKTAFKEIYTFWILQSVKKEDFHNQNIHVWDEWFLEDDTLGKSYAYQFESRPRNNVIKIKKKLKKHHGDLKPIIVGEKEEINKNCKDEMIGKKITNDRGQECLVINVYKTGTHYPKSKSAKIQFTETNSTLILQYGDLKRGNFRDKYSRSIYGVGYVGNYESVKNISKEDVIKLRDIWNNIISRCYNENNSRFSYYGGKGVFVDERWHSFENFLEDVKVIPQWFLRCQNKKKYYLDKDYYGSNCYSRDTCVWLDNSDNVLYSGEKGKPFEVYYNDTYVGLFISTIDASRQLNIDFSTILRRLKDGKSKNGFTFNYLNDEEYIYRYDISKNQVVDLINNINSNKYSRRLMTSFWNDTDVSQKALQECAMQTTWNVRDGKLDLLLYSRSVDAPLGLPFNWIQYWFLLQMVAQVTGYKAGKFIHQMGNVHYYDAHEELILKQIESDTYAQPSFKINDEIKSFFDFAIDDIEISNYQNGGKYTYPVAI